MSKRFVQRKICIGDPHGCREELVSLLDKVKYKQGVDDLYILGDYVDRGPDAIGTIRLARALGAKGVRGNHDDKHLKFSYHERIRQVDPAYVNPVSLSEEKRLLNSGFSEEDLSYLDSLPAYIALSSTLLLVHAGMAPGVRLKDQKSKDLLHIRFVELTTGKPVPKTYRPSNQCVHWSRKWDGGDNGETSIIYGHYVHSLKNPDIYSPSSGIWCFGIDTGCCFGGRLTALVFYGTNPAHYEIVQVSASRAYATFGMITSDDGNKSEHSPCRGGKEDRKQVLSTEDRNS